MTYEVFCLGFVYFRSLAPSKCLGQRPRKHQHSRSTGRETNSQRTERKSSQPCDKRLDSHLGALSKEPLGASYNQTSTLV